MNRATFYVGLGAHAPDRMRRLGDLAAAEFGGYTLTQGKGGWRDKTGAIVREPCAVLEVFTDCVQEDCRAFAAHLAFVLGEQCIGLHFAPAVSLELVEPAPQRAQVRAAA